MQTMWKGDKRMKVETFEQNEVMDDGTVEKNDDPQALEIIERLGLRGQKMLMSGDDTTRAPYRQMTPLEKAVYSSLFTRHSELCDYDGGMIPVRVLQVASHARELGIFNRIEIWSEEGIPKDPVLVGLQGTQYEKVTFILARWGNALESLDVLTEKARVAIRLRIKRQLEDSLRNIQSHLTNLDNLVERELAGERVYI